MLSSGHVEPVRLWRAWNRFRFSSIMIYCFLTIFFVYSVGGPVTQFYCKFVLEKLTNKKIKASQLMKCINPVDTLRLYHKVLNETSLTNSHIDLTGAQSRVTNVAQSMPTPTTHIASTLMYAFVTAAETEFTAFRSNALPHTHIVVHLPHTWWRVRALFPGRWCYFHVFSPIHMKC